MIKQRILSGTLFVLVIAIAMVITVLPTFFTKGISRVALQQDIDLELVLSSDKDIEFVFFGYAGCLDVCTPRLQQLGTWFASQPQKVQERVGVRFFDLAVPTDQSVPHTFAQSFHKSFQGVFLSEKVLRSYTKAFSVYFAKALMRDGEIDHSAHLYLVKRYKKRKQLRFIYTAYPYDFKQMSLDVEELLHE
jgi:protein SCO1/2